MNSDYIIAGDWGTSTLRLYLIELVHGSSAVLLDTKGGPGVSIINSDPAASFSAVLAGEIGGWLAAYNVKRVILSGMIGSSIGWREAPYTECPASCSAHVKAEVTLAIGDVPVSIMGGLQTQSLTGLSDTMRGEETQLLGLSTLIRGGTNKSQIVALPGTHNKWALLENGEVVNFITGFTGELFAVLREHTILLAGDEALDLSANDFERGVQAIIDSQADLVHLLFNVRARQLVERETGVSSLAYMLGMIIGSDIRGALALFSGQPSDSLASIVVLGAEQHTQTYDRALKCFGIESDSLDAEEVALAAYVEMFKQLTNS